MNSKKLQEKNQTQMEAILSILLRWYDIHGRSLPWRLDRSVYHTIISEFMLQQTRVQAMIPHYLRWVETFPTWKDVANASQESLLKHWEGLGYYGRVAHLHRLCHFLHETGDLPKSPEEWQKLPGIGPYTSIAIASIGQNYDAICIDGNVIRVLARLTGVDQQFPHKPAAERHFRPIANQFIIPNYCRQINEALMDFGAMVCRSTKRECNSCPLQNHCEAWQKNLSIDRIPLFAKNISREIVLHRMISTRHGKVLLQKSQKKRLKNIYEFPKIHTGNVDALPPSSFIGRRSIGNNHYEEHFLRIGENFAKFLDMSAGHPRWMPISSLDKIILSGPHRRWLPHLIPWY
ncbi:MAG: hypothetical protein LBG86_01700 [Puniceicoccales bacterium]|jgi:A/G-specific adenine glycosylase|nr:hypothetical protein [Puniceicoccales bacterium]